MIVSAPYVLYAKIYVLYKEFKVAIFMVYVKKWRCRSQEGLCRDGWIFVPHQNASIAKNQPLNPYFRVKQSFFQTPEFKLVDDKTIHYVLRFLRYCHALCRITYVYVFALYVGERFFIYYVYLMVCVFFYVDVRESRLMSVQKSRKPQKRDQ